ncbi:MAG TPA: hypothetical protein VGK78_03040 [Nocardioides sp.]|uniref:hypothetical protein n=1 Tax=Nocardioides sp. TaxID=35761 RepID=UPI002F409111
MKATRSLLVAAPTLALALAPAATSYALERPHTRAEPGRYAAPAPADRPFPVTGLATGDRPRIPYAVASSVDFLGGDWVLRHPDGSTLRLPTLTWSVWAPMGDGAIGMAGTEAGPELQRVSGTGAVRSRLIQHFGLAVSPDHEIVGWLGDRGSPRVVEGGGTRSSTIPRVGRGTVIASIEGPGTCQEQAPEGGGCTVFVNGRRHAWASTSHGLVDRVAPALKVSDVSQRGRVAGLLSRRTDTHRACWGVVRADGHRVVRTCNYYLDTFSPDGRRVLGERSETRWASVNRFAVFGRDGHVVRSWVFDPGRHRSLSQLTWEDSRHLLGVLHTRGRWGIVRIGTDGTVEYAGATVAATDELTPFSLPLR